MTSVGGGGWGVTVNPTDIESIKWEYYEQLYVYKFN